MQLAPIALAIGGSLLKARAANKAGNDQRKLSYGQALEEETASAAQELQIRESARKAIGQQLAAQSSNGFLGGTGSGLDALAESQTNALLDAMRVRREAAARAASLRSQGNQARSAGRMSAVESLIGGASQVLGMKSDWAAVQAPYKANGGGASSSSGSSGASHESGHSSGGGG